ncbi:MAG: HNH endonuclease [Geodermatophilaceae bacterium]
MVASEVEERVRAAMFAHLDGLADGHPDGLRSADINRFEVDGMQVRLVVQPGIRKPHFLDAALTIRTAFTHPGQLPPYEDTLGDDGFVRYKYRGLDPQHPDNRALRQAMLRQLPLAYFVGIAAGVYHAQFPVFIIGEDMATHEFVVAVDEAQRLIGPESPGEPTALRRAYVQRLTRERLHQPVFRARVLQAYRTQCSICQLRHADLLDAAHILPDGHPRGHPVVPNGLAMCKIHHAAYDRNILGVRPDLRVHVRADILNEIDGPMLRHGLQEMDGRTLSVPSARASRPDPESLDERYELFRQAG